MFSCVKVGAPDLVQLVFSRLERFLGIVALAQFLRGNPRNKLLGDIPVFRACQYSVNQRCYLLLVIPPHHSSSSIALSVVS